MKYIILVALLFFGVSAMAGEGHIWTKLNYQSKALIVASYDIGVFEGCGKGVRLSTSDLFADQTMQMKNSIRLVFKCPGKVIATSDEMSKVIDIADKAYGKVGAANINIISMVVASLKSYASGKSAIDEKALKRMIAISNMTPIL